MVYYQYPCCLEGSPGCWHAILYLLACSSSFDKPLREWHENSTYIFRYKNIISRMPWLIICKIKRFKLNDHNCYITLSNTMKWNDMSVRLQICILLCFKFVDILYYNHSYGGHIHDICFPYFMETQCYMVTQEVNWRLAIILNETLNSVYHLWLYE